MIIISGQFTVQADFSIVNAELDALRGRVIGINAQIASTNIDMNKSFSDGTRLLNVILGNLQNNALAMKIQAAQQVVQTGVTLTSTLAAITVARATGNMFGVVSLSAAAVSLTANLVAARIASQEAERRSRDLERLNRTRAALR